MPKLAVTKPIRALTLLMCGALCTTFLCEVPRAQTDSKRSLGVLKILSVRKMTGEEYARRITDRIAATYLVRYRYEAPAENGIYLFSPNYGPPMGNGLQRTKGVIKWSWVAPGGDSSKDPGFKRVEQLLGSGWILLTPTAAIEWEGDAEPTGDSEVATCLFVKTEFRGEPSEVLSPWFRIPTVDAPQDGKLK